MFKAQDKLSSPTFSPFCIAGNVMFMIVVSSMTKKIAKHIAIVIVVFLFIAILLSKT